MRAHLLERSQEQRSGLHGQFDAGARERIIPFFEEHRPLIKGPDFDLFATIVDRCDRKEHLEPDGFNRVVTLAYAMNANGKQRSRPIEEVLQGSSETIR